VAASGRSATEVYGRRPARDTTLRFVPQFPKHRRRRGELLESGRSVELVNRIIRVFKTVLFHGVVDLEVIERNVLMRCKQYEHGESGKGRRVNRGAFTEEEVQKLLAAARPHERALIGLLCFTGVRPGEAFALRWQDVNLMAGAASISRTWDCAGRCSRHRKPWLVTEPWLSPAGWSRS